MADWHRHLWIDIQSPIVGLYEKQEGQTGSEFLCAGTRQACRFCPKQRIVPFDKRLRPVEVQP